MDFAVSVGKVINMSPNTPYYLTTRWALRAPVGSVWTELTRPEEWPKWWRGILAVKLLESGDANGVGAYRRIVWRGSLPYRVIFNVRIVRIEPRSVIEARIDGEVSGVGRWQLQRSAGATDVCHEWIVQVNKPRMQSLGPLAGLLFRWNHRTIMNWGYKGLERRIGMLR